MRLTNEGLSLWYGTPDAPAPGDDGVVARRGAALVVAAHPASPFNALSVRYRVDGGQVRTLPARELRTDHDRQVQYFGATFPESLGGDRVEYLPVLTCGGRQVPAPQLANHFPSKFQLAPLPEPKTDVAPGRIHQETSSDARHFTAGLGFVASVSVQFSEIDYVSDTAAGMRVNFFVQYGTVEGEGFKGTVIANSADHLIVRRDGMGEIRIRAAFATADGGKLDVEAGGYVDFGPDAYRRALARDLPDRAPIVVTPLISTRHPRYRWLSRRQCIGVGYTNLDARKACYQIFVVSSHPVK